MNRPSFRARLALLTAGPALLAPTVRAQVADITLMQTSFTEVQIVLFTDLDNDGLFSTVGEARVLYSNGLNDENLTSNRDIVFRAEAGYRTAYWIDNRIDKLFRGQDLDGSGRIDVGEAAAFRDSIALDGPSRANGIANTPDGAVWWSSDGDTFRGIFRCFDGNGDFDANDPSEQVTMVSGTHPIDVGGTSVGISSGTFVRLTPVGNAVVAFNSLDHSALFRFEDQNSDGDVLDPSESIVFLNATGENPNLPVQPDFAAAVLGSNPRSLVITAAPPSNGWLSLVTTQNEGGQDVVYAACDSSWTSSFSKNQYGEYINGLIFRCVDQNLDGDANDAGEVQTFYDGSLNSVGVEVLDKIIGMSSHDGWLYVCELHNNSAPSMHRLRDNNADGDAMDAGEQQLFLWDSNFFLPNPPFGLGTAPFVTEIGATAKDSFPMISCQAATTYCTALVSSNGCLPALTSTGVPSLGNPAGFSVVAGNLESAQNGLLFFGTSGQNNTPFFGGTLCVKAPLTRLMIKNSGGAATCSGSISYTLADFLASTGGASLLLGTTVNCQVWTRDPPAAQSVSLTDAAQFQICP